MITLPNRLQPTVSFGGAEIQRTEDGRWRTEFEHRGSQMELFGDSLFALRDTLLELQKTSTPLEQCIEEMDEWSHLRLYECYTTRPSESPWQMFQKDEWLLLNGLIFYGPKNESWESTYPAAHPERYPLSLTNKGKEIASLLFYEPKKDLERKEKREIAISFRKRLVKKIYSVPVAYERPEDVFVALHWSCKVLAISECRDEAYEALQQDTECMERKHASMSLHKVKPGYIIPPFVGANASEYWVKNCTELLWEKK